MSLDHRATVFEGSSAAADRLRLQVQRFAPHFRTMLLVGEAGAGKESVGRELHRLSPIAGESFCTLDIADFVAGADCGRIAYLRGLADAAAGMHDGLVQRLAGLGRETRLIVACEGEPRALLAAGRLSAEVLERVGMLEIRVPALRERLEDLAPLSAAMLAELECGARWGKAELDAASAHPWPGNLHELRTACRSFAAAGALRLGQAAEPGRAGTARADQMRLEEVVSRHVMDVLERCAGNKLKAAELLGISRSTLYRMLDSTGQA